MSMSGLLFGTIDKGTLTPRLEFGGESRATAYFELYGGGPGDQVSVVFELAERVEGPSRLSIPGSIRSDPAGPRLAAVEIRSIRWQPATCSRAIVSVNGVPVGRVMRTLRKK
jgi:hypothetical protein